MDESSSGKGVDKSRLSTHAWERSLRVSLAGAKAGGAFAFDSLSRKFNPFSQQRALSESEARSASLSREAEKFVAELGRLKGSYVKIGQVLAQFGEHFLPHELTAALHQLESGTQPLSWETVREMLHELGAQQAALEVEPEPIAAASLAQVHRAHLENAAPPLCLKIQYPGLRETIDADFDSVVRMLMLARLLQKGKQAEELLARMRAQLHREMDYRHELAMLSQYREHCQVADRETAGMGRARFYVPRAYPEFCSTSVLTMEYVPALSVSSKRVQALSQSRRNALGKAMLELFFLELFEWRLMQTDPNFGNYMIQVGHRAADDRLVVLDFGAVDRLRDSFANAFCQTIQAGIKDESQALIAGLQALSCLTPQSSVQACSSFAEFCRLILEPMLPPEALPAEYLNRRGEYDWARSNLIKRAARAASSASLLRHFEMPGSDFAYITRKLLGVFTFISVLGAQFNGYEIAARYLADKPSATESAS